MLSHGKLSNDRKGHPDLHLIYPEDMVTISCMKEAIPHSSSSRKIDFGNGMYHYPGKKTNTVIIGYKYRDENFIRWFKACFIQNTLYLDFSHFYEEDQLVPVDPGNAETLYYTNEKSEFSNAKSYNPIRLADFGYE